MTSACRCECLTWVPGGTCLGGAGGDTWGSASPWSPRGFSGRWCACPRVCPERTLLCPHLPPDPSLRCYHCLQVNTTSRCIKAACTPIMHLLCHSYEVVFQVGESKAELSCPARWFPGCSLQGGSAL